jgi:hypothetical protein
VSPELRVRSSFAGRHPALAESGAGISIWSAVRIRGTPSPVTDMLAYLMGGEIDAPDSGRDVGPFVNLEGVLRGAARTMLLLRDSYPSLR